MSSKNLTGEPDPDERCSQCGVKRKDHYIMVHEFTDKER